jgi:MoCo/4Fe-4S cofactor protein with predicted Tat translocation signal
MMALDFDTNSGPTGAGDAPDQFQSLEQVFGSPEFERMMKDEFPEDAAEWLDPVSRRNFLALSGASVALAAAAGCNPSLKPASQKKIIPYVKKPEQITPGIPLFYPTALTLGGVALGVIVKCVEGRPIKVEGNPAHPGSLGGTDIFAQATILDVYDPDRSKGITEKGVPSTWEKARLALTGIVAAQTAKKGAGLRIVTEPVADKTTLANLIGELKARLPDLKWIQYEAVGKENTRQGVRDAYGSYLTPIFDFKLADRIVAIDADFLSDGVAGVRYSRDAMHRRKVRVHDAKRRADGVSPDQLSRIYAIESTVTGIGGVADHRLPLKPSEIESFVRLLAKEVGVADAPAAGPLPERAKTYAHEIAVDLKDKANAGVVVVGGSLSVVAQNLMHAINDAIGAVAKGVVKFVEPVQAGLTGAGADAAADGTGSLKALADELQAGKVDALLILGGNPAFTAPADLNFAAAMQKATVSVHLGLHADETAALSTWHVNAAHELESWGDARGHDGTATVQQPLVSFHGGKSAIELVAAMLDKPGSTESLVKDTWRKFHADQKIAVDFDKFWHTSVERGVIEGTAAKPAAIKAGDAKLSDATKKAPAPATKAEDIELSFRPDPTIHDGRFANNGWLQELPKPISLICWDNAALVSAATAERLKCEVSFKWTGGEHGKSEADKIEITVGDRKVRVPVWVLPGQADDVITLFFGYGREKVGEVGKQGSGFNIYPIRTTANLWTVGGIKPQPGSAERTQEKYILAATQGQHAMEGRRPARHGTKTQALAELDEVNHGDHKHYHVKHHKDAFSFADNPPASAAEKDLMRALLPGTPKEREWLASDDHPQKFNKPKGPNALGYVNNAAHNEEEDEKKVGEKTDEHKHEVDKRLMPLTLIQDHANNKLYRRWAMAIDLGACIGCNACAVACVAENNIPVLGKKEVTKGRIMHWIRIDRYFSVPHEVGGTKKMDPKERAEAIAKATADVSIHFQPVPCQQCEKAPCELVCPVAATAHSADGLNDMAYNRCVGTRYCANNCPYKVRRFNFVQYANYDKESTLQLVNNPEVTMRTRGVMEKCTYCVQRIRTAEIEAEREHDNPNRRKVRTPTGIRPLIEEGEIKTACQAACPSNAISFGDLNYDQYVPVKKVADKWEPTGKHLAFSEVSRWKLEPSNYGLLAELNTMPRTSYLAAIKNPNPKLLADAGKGGHG